MDNRHDSLATDLIWAKDFSFTYDNSPSVSLDVGDLTISQGQFVVVCGPSGGGKSTLLKLLNGLIPDYFPGQLEGDMQVADLKLGASRAEVLARRVASVFQEPDSQFFHKVVKEELVFPAENQGRPVATIKQELENLVQAFDLSAYLEREMKNLSGGEKQRMALLTAIMQDSPILVLDEPVANLDQAGKNQVREHLALLKASGKTIIVAEHQLDYVSDLADRYLYVNQGRLETDWTAQAFADLTEAQRQERSLRSSHLLDWSALPGPGKQADGLHVTKLSLRAGTKDLGQLPDLNFPRGQITAILGENGAGKSTLARYLVGLADDKKAQFLLDGRRLSARKRLEATALVLQDVRMQLFSHRVDKELQLGLSEPVDIAPICQALGLSGLEQRHPMTLSGGEQQRLVIASQLLSDKEVFIFDEPTSGLDLTQMTAVANLLKDLAQKNKVVILISHDLELLSLVADQTMTIEKKSEDG